MLLWSMAAVGLLFALAAFFSSRRLSRKLEALNQAYWELRYDYTRLRSQVARLDPDTAEPQEPEEPAAPQASISFVPLSSIRKKDH